MFHLFDRKPVDQMVFFFLARLNISEVLRARARPMPVTGAINGSCTQRLYQELGLEYLQDRRWFRKLSVFYKIVKDKSPKYLYVLIPSNNISYQRRNSRNLVIPHFKIKNIFSFNSFFPSTLVQWNNLDSDIRNSPSYSSFKKRIQSL